MKEIHGLVLKPLLDRQWSVRTHSGDRSFGTSDFCTLYLTSASCPTPSSAVAFPGRSSRQLCTTSVHLHNPAPVTQQAVGLPKSATSPWLISAKLGGQPVPDHGGHPKAHQSQGVSTVYTGNPFLNA